MFGLLEMFIILLLPVLCILGCSLIISFIENDAPIIENDTYAKFIP